MEIYLMSFFVSVSLFAIGEKVKKKQRIYIDTIAILILCSVAGFRSENIGTDTRGYFRPIIELSRNSNNYIDFFNSSFTKYVWRVDYVKDYDIGFITVIYILQKLTNSVVVIQFVIELLIIVPIYKVLRKRTEIPTWLGMLVFCGMKFNPSLNMIRQSISMSFNLLSTQFWVEGNKKNCILFGFFSLLFHKTAIILIPILFLYTFVNKNRDNSLRFLGITVKNENINFYIAIFAGLLVVFLTNIFTLFLDRLGLSSLATYISGNVRFMPNQIISRLPGIILLLIGYKGLDKYSGSGKFYLLMLIYEIILAQFTSVNQFSGRIGMYFSMYSLISYPSSATHCKYKRLLTMLLIAYLAFYWWFYFVYIGADETIPYMLIGR